jgi:hypothetical protein
MPGCLMLPAMSTILFAVTLRTVSVEKVQCVYKLLKSKVIPITGNAGL